MSDQMLYPPGHFYSPLPDRNEAESAIAKAAEVPVASLPGLAIDDDGILKTWEVIQPWMAQAPFPLERTDGFRYFYKNDFYSFGDAQVYFAMICHFKPKRIIEIGSGYSSAVALDTRRYLGRDIQLTFIEPHTDRLEQLIRPGDENSARFIRSKVQNLSPDFFDHLREDDFLFIDSSHVLKTGSDVAYEFFEIFPRLRKGVIVHLHDIHWPFEYVPEWVREGRAWNEVYALRAFLTFNSAFEVLFFNHYFWLRFPELSNKDGSLFSRNCGGAFWMRRR